MAPFVGRWAGGEGQGRAALCSSQQSGLQFPQTPQQNDSGEVMLTRTLTHTVNELHSHTNTGVKGECASDTQLQPETETFHSGGRSVDHLQDLVLVSTNRH